MKALLMLLPASTLAACVDATTAVPAQPGTDACQAARFQGLVGQSRTVLDSMRLPPATRVVGPHDAVTMDYRPDRLNFELDERAVIAKIGCY
jgi:hypothetical protein